MCAIKLIREWFKSIIWSHRKSFNFYLIKLKQKRNFGNTKAISLGPASFQIKLILLHISQLNKIYWFNNDDTKIENKNPNLKIAIVSLFLRCTFTPQPFMMNFRTGTRCRVYKNWYRCIESKKSHVPEGYAYNLWVNKSYINATEPPVKS